MAHIGRPGYSLTQPLARSTESGTETHKVLYYVEEDEDMMESGEDFKKILKLPIELVVVKGGG